jgi:hypothetical protein
MDSTCINKQPTTDGVHVALPNRQTIQAAHTCDLNQPQLQPGARTAHKFPQLAHALLSIGQLCNNGCTATFTAKEVRVTAQNGLVLRGIRDPTTGLWKIPLTPQLHAITDA